MRVLRYRQGARDLGVDQVYRHEVSGVGLPQCATEAGVAVDFRLNCRRKLCGSATSIKGVLHYNLSRLAAKQCASQHHHSGGICTTGYFSLR